MSLEGKRSVKSPSFSRSPKAGVSSRDYAVHGKNTKMYARALYYDSAKPTPFATLDKLSVALPRNNKSDVRA